jgi:site-specific recombinase XerD
LLIEERGVLVAGDMRSDVLIPMLGACSIASAAPERADRISLEYIDHRFQAARGALGLPDGLDFHSLRRSYVTHLTEDGADRRFIQQQVGHECDSSTAVYTSAMTS